MAGVNRVRLQELLDESGKSARKVSRLARRGDTAVRDLLNGKSRDPGFETLSAIAAVLGVDVREIVDQSSADLSPLPHLTVAPKFLPVRYRVQAGAWVEIDAEEALLPVSIAVVPHPRYAAWAQWLEVVVGDSVNLKIPPGHYAHVVDAIEMGYAPRDGDWVVVERRRNQGGERERTIKQVEIDRDGTVRLRSRSSNPKWAKHAALAFKDGQPVTEAGQPMPEGDEVEVEIVGKVVGAYDPEF